MASLSTDPSGRRRIQFADPGGKRHTLRLGKIPKKSAETIRVHVEHLIAAGLAGTAPPEATARWLAGLGDDLHERLARAGLVEPRAKTAGRTIDDLARAHREVADVKDTTRVRYDQTRRRLVAFFGPARTIDTIGSHDAERWKADLLARGYAPATAGRDVTLARMLFRAAVRWGWLASNPFEGVRGGSQTNRDRLHNVEPETAHTLIERCPNHDWRCVVALARWGGLRTPSETLRARWSDVDWARNRMRVRSPKTEHHAGRGERTIPLFPELRAVLVEAFEAAEPGAEHVVGRYRDVSAINLRTQLLRILDRAGIPPWPRLFNALRASRATELAHEYPAATCEAWMGHTAAIALAHYHMVTEDDYARASATPSGATRGATQNPTRHPPAGKRTRGNPARPDDDPAPACVPVRRVADHKSFRDMDLVSGPGLEPGTSRM